MYNHHFNRLGEDHRQQLLQEAANRRLQACLSHRSGILRHLIGRLGVALVAVGSRLERVEHSEQLRPAKLSSLHQPS